VDLAAGTGLLSRVLARKVDRVVAIELDERMAAVLRARSADVHVIRGVAEALPLADASVDAVLVSSAWHWFDTERAVPELGRVLRDGGRLGVIWNGANPEVEWIRELRHRRSPQTDAAQTDAAQRNRPRSRSQTPLPETGVFGNASRTRFDSTRTMAADDLVDMLATYSAVITATEDDRAAELARVRTVLGRLFPGAAEIHIPMTAWCWHADRVPRASR
jgi:SAM-dependent methyltransferase